MYICTYVLHVDNYLYGYTCSKTAVMSSLKKHSKAIGILLTIRIFLSNYRDSKIFTIAQPYKIMQIIFHSDECNYKNYKNLLLQNFKNHTIQSFLACYSRAWNNSRPSAIFRSFSGIWPSKSNLLGQIYYTFSMGNPVIVYKNVPILMNGRPISNPYFKLCYSPSNWIIACNKISR